MATEIERKYLLSHLPRRARDGRCAFVVIEQGWIGRLRLRTTAASGAVEHHACVKFGRGLVRREFEYRVPGFLFHALWPFTLGRRVLKARYVIEDGDLVWELDAFLDRALVLAEVELPLVNYPAPIPEWLRPAVVREVTGEAQYVNIKLAK